MRGVRLWLAAFGLLCVCLGVRGQACTVHDARDERASANCALTALRDARHGAVNFAAAGDVAWLVEDGDDLALRPDRLVADAVVALGWWGADFRRLVERALSDRRPSTLVGTRVLVI